ncbi:MAG: LysM peptidoglycan-binding domain-containing protein [Rhodanobacter sp.]
MMTHAENMPPAKKIDVLDVPRATSAIVDESSNYVVAAGDTLATIAEHFYGDGTKWKRLLDANRDQLVDPDHLRPGLMLKIPAKI